MQFDVDGKKLILKGDTIAVVQIVEAKEMQQLLNKRLPGVMAQMCRIQANPSTEEHPNLTQILQDYKDVFEEPKGLPPFRAHDHQIPLKLGTQPPSIRPYRYPYIQKN